MRPDKAGRVPEESLPRDRRYRAVKDMRYPMRRFGIGGTILQDWLREKVKSPKTAPTQVWITSLCSYWFESVAETCRIVHGILPEASIVLLGNYPRLLPEHACKSCVADYVPANPPDLSDRVSTFDLYEGSPPPFVAVQMNAEVAVQEIAAAVKRAVYHVAFFADDICVEEGGPLVEIVQQTKGLHRHLRFHAICGLHPSKVTPKLAKCLARQVLCRNPF